jgi:LDH2 family malate/lactate/ureidoglycolate dehydrogenase
VAGAVIHRYGFDELRRFAAGIAGATGLAPARALALASHLLWFDAAGAPSLGIATLSSWLEAIDAGRVDPLAVGRVVSERTTLALLDGENGPPPLILERAAELAVEKAREAAVGLVKVVGVGPIRSSAPIAAGIAIGPMAGWVLGPDRCWSMALPTSGGLPLVVDSGLPTPTAEASGGGKPGTTEASGRRATEPPKTASSHREGPVPVSPLLEGFWLGTEVLVPEGGWLVAAVSINAMEPLSAFHDRVAAGRERLAAAGRAGLLPEEWEAHRRRAQQQGVMVDPAAWKSLVHRAHRLNIDVPRPIPD